MILDLYCFLHGFVTVRISGRLNEKIINKCIREEVFMWDIKSKDDALTLNIRARDFERLKTAADGAKITIVSKKGVPFIVRRFKKRYALTLGVAVFAGLIFLLSSVVWTINIKGCKITDPKSVMKILDENGVRKGCFKGAVDTEKLQNEIMKGLDTISWIGIDLKGTTINIEVKERRETPYMVDDSAYDLVALKDGVISEMRVRNGEKVVSVGDTVVKGQLLVSALVERDGENILPKPYTVHSYGDVIARTWYTFKIKQPLYRVETEYTGREYSRRRLKFLDFDINLYIKNRILYSEYDKITKTEGAFLKLETETIREIKTNRVELDTRAALKIAEEEARKKLPEEVITATCLTADYESGSDFINASIVFECTENIAVETPYTERREETNDSENSEN